MSDKVERLIFHVDVNSAFLAWEATRRVRQGEADLRLIPSAVGGDREKRTGVILAKSIPAKKFGIITGEPIATALRKCPQLVLVRSDFRLYQENSRAFMEICRTYAPVVEKYSIDECFLDMSGTQVMYPDPIATAYEIKNKIRDTLGFTVNIGIGTNKLLAKMAGDLEKPDKVHTIFPSEIAQKMWPLPVQDLFSVGESTAQKLIHAGVKTIGDLAVYPTKSLQTIVGVKMGRHLHDYANGVDYSEVHAEAEEAKGYSNSTTLAEDVVTSEEAHRVLLALADSVAARLRADGAKAFCVGVTIRGNDFRDHSHQLKLDYATDITGEIYSISKQLFEELWDHHTPLRLLAIALTNVTRDETEQLSLFSQPQKEKARKLDQVVDHLRNRFGSNTIVRGAICNSSIEVAKKYKAQVDAKKE